MKDQYEGLIKLSDENPPEYEGLESGVMHRVRSKTREWFRIRSIPFTITATHAGELVGASPYVSEEMALEDLRDKSRRRKRFDEGNPAFAEHGSNHEEFTEKCFEELLGVRSLGESFWQHRKLPFLFSTPDGIFPWDDKKEDEFLGRYGVSRSRPAGLRTRLRIAEFKNPCFRLQNLPKGQYVVQCYMQMFTTGADAAYLFETKFPFKEHPSPRKGFSQGTNIKASLWLIERNAKFERWLVRNLARARAFAKTDYPAYMWEPDEPMPMPDVKKVFKEASLRNPIAHLTDQATWPRGFQSSRS